MIRAIREHKFLILILVFGFLVSVFYAFYFHIRPVVDARAYDAIAWSLTQGQGYVETGNPIADNAMTRVGPGYEFFLAGIYLIFGHHIRIVWIAQSLLHVLSGCLVYLIIVALARERGFNKKTYALMGTGLYISFIDLLEFPAMLMSETLYLFLVLLGTYLAIRLWQRLDIERVVWTALVLTLAVLVRAPAIFLVGVVIGLLLYRRAYRYVIIFVAVCLSLLAPWTIRNYIIYHRLIVTNAVLGYDLWVGNNPRSQYPGELADSDEMDAYAEQHGVFAANDRGSREFFQFLKDQPLAFTKLQFLKASIYFSAARPAAFWPYLHGRYRSVTVVLSSLWSYGIFVLGLAGLIWYGFQRKMPVIILYTLAAPLSVIAIIAETRYRYQIYPMMIILGMLFLSDLIELRNNKKILIWITILVTANTSFDAWRNFARLIGRAKKLF